MASPYRMLQRNLILQIGVFELVAQRTSREANIFVAVINEYKIPI